MQSQFTRYFVVGLLAIALSGAALVGESSAQWGRFAQPYYVNYNANFYPVYPAYVAWRPFGGLFAGVHNLLCHRCWMSPCCCVTPMICDPCFDACDPCADSCCNLCGVAVDSCACAGYFGYYDQPKSLTLGTHSPTGFGSITPSTGATGQRPVGTPISQQPMLRSTIRTPQTSLPFTTPQNYSTPYTPQDNEQPTLAPPQQSDETQAAPAVIDLDSRLDGLTRPAPYVPGQRDYGITQPIRSNEADNPPSTRSDGWWNNSRPAPGDGSQSVPDSTSTPGGSSTNNLRMDLGSGTISVTVPENARVYINGYETRMTGVNRRYVVNDLEPGMQYDYEIRIVAQVNGRTVEETQQVTLSSGQQGLVAFGRPQPQSDNVRYVATRPAH